MKRLELQGKRFERLLVEEWCKEKGAWKCFCDCGAEKYVKSSDLVAGKTKSCGCLSKEKAHNRRLQLKNQRFGRLLVLEEIEERRNKQIYWKCQCDCGNICEVPTARLVKGATQSCGCLHKEQLAERNANNSTVQLGNIYGFLTVIQDLGFRKQNSRDKNERWSLCQCKCGNICEVSNNRLQTGNTSSCGCLYSLGEATIEKIFQGNGIHYIKQYSFSDLRNIRPLKFDFAVFEDDKLLFLVEFDGRQHYTGPEATWTHSHTLEEIQRADIQKNNYCIQKGYKLKRIPYYKIRDISLETLLDDTFTITDKGA